MASSFSTPITFTGQSTFSSSLQQVLQRAVSIASLPMQELQNEVSKLQSQQSDLNGMQTIFGRLQSSVQAISTSMSGEMTASSSDSGVVSAQAESTTLPGTYSIQVADVGSSTSAMSNEGLPVVTDASTQNISTSSVFTLAVNGATTIIKPASNSLSALATAINSANAGVSATIVNLGSNSSPDYRLALNSTELGPDTIQLNDGTSDLLTTLQPGTEAQYTVNGSSTVLSSNSNQITLAPGLTANLLSADPGQTVTITVAASEGNLSNALANFAAAFNNAAGAVQTETGKNAGALAGQSLVYALQNTLSRLSQFVNASGSVQSLSDLGLTLGDSGTLTFDASQFSSADASAVQQFLGGLTSGGFLQTANDVLSSAADTTHGMIATQSNNLATEITSQNSQIADDQNRINLIQANLTQQLSAADAAIAVLQQQSSYYSSLNQTTNANHMAGL